VLDSGNCFLASRGSPSVSDDELGTLIVRAMNGMGYDAMALGEMDLASLPVMQARFREADFPILSANVDTAGELPNVRPYLLEEIGGHTVAIIGATNDRIGQVSQDWGSPLAVGNAIEAVQRTVQEVKEQANIVVVLSNLDRETNQTLAREAPGIDAIIGASGGQQSDEVTGPEGLVVLQAAGTRGEYLGVLTLNLDDGGRVAAFDARQMALTPNYADDPYVASLIQELKAGP